ncbi:hypothetical protein B0H19DRAFT_1060137 [Mycena capillaripes]|nr:hypothetical protein B0H19DRAFT_1060137 [Mycena capillaripes]
MSESDNKEERNKFQTLPAMDANFRLKRVQAKPSGCTDGEGPERAWAKPSGCMDGEGIERAWTLAQLCPMSKEMGPGSRQDKLDDASDLWNPKGADKEAKGLAGEIKDEE